MSINTDNVKAGDWVQVANGDWWRVELEKGPKQISTDYFSYGDRFVIWTNQRHALTVEYLNALSILTAHATAEEVEANGLPVSDEIYKGIENFACWLLDNAEGETITEEQLRPWAVKAYEAIQQQRKDEK